MDHMNGFKWYGAEGAPMLMDSLNGLRGDGSYEWLQVVWRRRRPHAYGSRGDGSWRWLQAMDK